MKKSKVLVLALIVTVLLTVIMLSISNSKKPPEIPSCDTSEYYLLNKEYEYSASVVANEPHPFASPIKTNSTRIKIYNNGDQMIVCTLYLATYLTDPIKTIIVESQSSGVFGELTAASLYHLSFETDCESIDIVLSY